jgi:hypothetical protein
MKVVIETHIECGERTCATEPGKFCHKLGTKKFGSQPWCMLFDEQLFEQDGWVQRCKQCVEAGKEATAG